MDIKIATPLDYSSPDLLAASKKLGFFILFLLAGPSFIFPRFFSGYRVHDQLGLFALFNPYRGFSRAGPIFEEEATYR